MSGFEAILTEAGAGAGAGGLSGLFSSLMGGGASTAPSMMGTGLLQPDILAQAHELAPVQGGSSGVFSDILKNIDSTPKFNPRPALQATPLQQPGQLAQIPQQDLIQLLQNLGGY